MLRRLLLALSLALVLPAPHALVAQSVADTRPVAGRYQIRTAPSAITADGYLTEPGWQDAVRIPLAYEWLPGDNVTPPVRTEALLTYDAEHLYVAFRASDPRPEEIRAHLMDRDDIFNFVQDDHVGFQIDPFNDERRSFQFRINPLGVQADALFSELDGVEDFSWDIIWKSAGRITADGYIVELAIPFSQLRFPSGDAPQTWGFEAFRSYPRSVRHRIRSHYVDRTRSCLLCQFDKVEGFQNLSTGHNVELTPTLTANRTDRRPAPEAAFDAGAVDPEVGFSGRWGVTPNFIVNGTINPDFSQVEADAAQLESNQRFALFFEEKRPFFLEGLDFFQTPLPAVFTRTVVDPRAGAKATGKIGPHALGVFATHDRVNSLLLPGNQRSQSAFLESDVTAGVVRYRRDVGAGSAVGLLYTGREGTGGYRNHVGGADAFIRLSPTTVLSGQVLRSSTAYPDTVVSAFDERAGSFAGSAVTLEVQHVSRHWIASASYEDLSPGFREDSGFMPRVDVRTGEASINRRIWSDGRPWFTQINVGLTASQTYDYDAELTDQLVSFTTHYSGPLQSSVFLRLDAEKILFAGETFDVQRAGLFTSLQPSGAVELGLSARYGEAVDFVGARPATLWRIGAETSLKLGRRLRTQGQYLVQQMSVDAGRLVTEQLFEARVRYHFTRQLFIRATAQLRRMDHVPSRYPIPIDELQQRLFSQLLLSYKLNPQTVFFLGYADNHRGADAYPLTQLDRTFFLKLGYAVVF